MVAAMCVVMSSCLKNDTPDYIPPVDPADEAAALQAFIDSTGYNLETQSDSLYYYKYNGQTGKGELTGLLAPYLYYEVVDPGNMSPGTTEVPDSELGGTKSGNTTVYNTLSDSTLFFSVSYTGTLLDGTVFDKTDEGKAYLAGLPNMIAAWQLLLGKVGRGGHIRILTPSYYAYANQSVGDIPANTPLYFDVYIHGFIKNDYASK